MSRKISQKFQKGKFQLVCFKSNINIIWLTVMQVGRWPTQYQNGHTGKWLQCQAKLLKNVSTIGQSAKKIQTLSQYAYAKLVLS
jgi:hypothetical protein